MTLTVTSTLAHAANVALGRLDQIEHWLRGRGLDEQAEILAQVGRELTPLVLATLDAERRQPAAADARAAS